MKWYYWSSGALAGINTASLALWGHYPNHLLGVTMPKYSEFHSYILGDIHREMAFLNMSILRMKHSLAILCTIPPVAENLKWVCLVDWCHIDIVTAEARIELWWRRLDCLWRANLLVEF